MRITVHEDKVRAELEYQTKGGNGHKLPIGKLGPECVRCLIARLGGLTTGQIAMALEKGDGAVSMALHTARERLGVRDDIELAYLAYERGYVVVEDER